MEWLKEAAARTPEFERDGLGLPRKPSSVETIYQVGMRKAQLNRDAQLLLRGVFAALEQDLSLEEAQRIFVACTKPAKPRTRGKHGERNPNKNQLLLTLFDQTPGDTSHERARKLADHLAAERPGTHWATRDSIIKQTLRLVDRREAKPE